MTTETADNPADEKESPATLQKNIESSCQSLSNMAAMGQLAAGIAHEINTPAQYVSDNIHFLQDAFDGFLGVIDRYRMFYQSVKSGTATSDTIRGVEEALADVDMEYLVEEVPQAIQQSLQGMERITQIIEAIRDFSHPGLMEKKRSISTRQFETRSRLPGIYGNMHVKWRRTYMKICPVCFANPVKSIR